MRFPKVKCGVYMWSSVDYSFTKDGQKIVKGGENIKFKITSQDGPFVFGFIADHDNINYIGLKAMGVIKKNNNSWDIHITTNVPDDREFIMTPTYYKSGKACEFRGIMIEPNYSVNPYTDGTPTVARVYMKWQY
jgi:hypothetical protein